MQSMAEKGDEWSCSIKQYKEVLTKSFSKNLTRKEGLRNPLIYEL